MHEDVLGGGLGSLGNGIQDGLRVETGHLGHVIEPTGFQAIGEFDPLLGVALAPEVTGGQGDGCGTLRGREELDGAVEVGQAAFVDNVTVVVRRGEVGADSLGVRHFTVEVGHHDEAHGFHDQSGSLIVGGFGFLGLLDEVLDVTGGTEEPVLVHGGGDTLGGVPVGLEAEGGGAGGVGHHLGDSAATGVLSTPGITIVILNPGQTVFASCTLVVRIIGVRVHIQPLCARGEGNEGGQDHKNIQYLFHILSHFKIRT